MTSSRSAHFSPDELETLVRCMESNPQLAHGKIGGNIATKVLLNSGWQAVAGEVNSVSVDIHRTSHQMRAKWFDYKYRVRQKATKITVRGGSLSDQKLTPLELRVLSLIGPGRVKAITDNGFDTGVVKQAVPCEVAMETSTAQVPVPCDENEENNVLCSELNSSEENGQTDILASSQIKKEVDSEMLECLNETHSSAVFQGNENHKMNDVQYTVLIPVQFPLLEQENGQNKSPCIQTTSVHQSVLPQKDTGESERFFIENGTIIPVHSRLSEQENETSEKNNVQNSPVIHVLSRFPEQRNVNQEQNANQSTPVLSNECNLPDEINGKKSKSALKITSVISKSLQQEKGKNKKSASKPTARLDASKSSQQESVPSNDTAQNWQLGATSSKGTGTIRSQRLRSRKRKLREEEENAVERQVIDTQAEMANELKKITTHLATIANTNIEILKYLKNVEKKQETVISYLSVALNLDEV